MRLQRHGMSKTAIYKLYHSIIARCTKKRSTGYKYYGARGIKCLWPTFESFYKDMGDRPSSKYSIERIDCNGHYCKETCKWIPKVEQSNNTTRSIVVTYRNKTQNLMQWCRELDFPYDTAKYRIEQQWTPEEVFKTPIMKEILIKIGKQSLTITQWSRLSGIPKHAIYRRLKKGWNTKSAIFEPISINFIPKRYIAKLESEIIGK